ncbi:enoyl-[acyl-carrier protein] reductase/trans-2-enoyl-CoA reductase (NAD+) [Hypnocyclicus thermotrophus]|uniref:Enoyl-[acyl-carrier-protein] reductase [NADH] n=1 Tax=Hypnocyclicus thermotrophus TaxID=1627895 RepID=A0AA46DZZ5_9FUSO|nr:enoyl-ACP reductase FabV [Hypnocyclicus thermotrophus]TDT72289.1 enoyl-[acyl-carrier protein] reductase/trans-2-enoyl-CoA reductase (NAD+) [Hypnocyclicus thermotrophus]
MIIEPKYKGGILLTAHPEGCKKLVEKQIKYVKNNKSYNGAKKALIIGASSGYGLATRISLAFGGSKTDTIGISYENGPRGKRTGTAGWYNNIFFKEAAEKEGLKAKNFVGDAFSLEMKDEVIKYIKEEFGKVDLVIYSLASGRRKDPIDGETYISALKSTTGDIVGPTVDLKNDTLIQQTMENATEEDIKATVKVMGGEDWELWIKALLEADVLEKGARTFAYTYIGPKITYGIYKDGTIGAAKRHLEKTAKELNKILKEKLSGEAAVSSNKALVTKASAYIPIFPVYATLLFKVMKEKGTHEGCIEQTHRLFLDMIYGDNPIIDKEGRYRPDNLEMEEDVQDKVNELWKQINENNFKEISDYAGFKKDFLQLGGFEVEGIDYSKDIDLETYAKLIP